MSPFATLVPSLGDSGPVLALDTSAGQCSVALHWGSREAYRVEPMTQGHSRVLLGMIDAVLAELGCDARRIAAVGYGSGPGSFTGLRVACGTAQGLALGWGCPVVAVDTLSALALQAALAREPARARADDLIAVALDLRMSEFCSAVYSAESMLDPEQWPRPLDALQLGPESQALERFAKREHGDASMQTDRADSTGQMVDQGRSAFWLAGDGFDIGAALRSWSAPLVQQARRPALAVQPDARAVALLAARGLRLGHGQDAADAAPVYLRDKVALDVSEQAALRAARAAAAGGAPR